MEKKIKQKTEAAIEKAAQRAKEWFAARPTQKVFDHMRLVGDLASECWVVPEGKSGSFSIRRKVIEIGERETVVSMRNAIFMDYKPMKAIVPDDRMITQLFQDGGTWMTDCYQEMFMLAPAIDAARGKVLIGGLGIGYSFQKIYRKPEVKSIIVVEKSADVIKLVWPAMRLWAAHVDSKKPFVVIQADLYEFLRTERPQKKFDFMSLDIWTATGEREHEASVQPLRKLAKRVLRPGGKIHCWGEETMEGQMRWNGREVLR